MNELETELVTSQSEQSINDEVSAPYELSERGAWAGRVVAGFELDVDVLGRAPDRLVRPAAARRGSVRYTERAVLNVFLKIV